MKGFHISDRRIVYILLCLGCVTISFNVAAIAAAIPAISSDLNLSQFLVSKIIPFYMVSYGLGALIYAPLTSWISYRLLLGIPLGLYSIASLYCASINSIWLFFAGRVAMGISGASAIPLGLIIIGQLFDKEVRGRLVGLFFGCSFFASIAGIIFSGMTNWRWLFYIPSILGASTAALIFLLKTNILNHIHGTKVDYLKSFENVEIRKLFIFIFSISFLYHGVHKWFGVYLNTIYNLDKLVISFFFMIISVCGAIGQIIGGYISDKKGRYWACLAGILILGLSTMLLYGIYPLYILAVVLGMLAMGWTIGHNGISTVLTDFPVKYRPAIASLNSSVRFVSGGIGFYISGFFVEKSFSLTFLFFGTAMLLLSLSLGNIIKK